jgi:hypothetical protein
MSKHPSTAEVVEFLQPKLNAADLAQVEQILRNYNDPDRILRGARAIGAMFDPPLSTAACFYLLEQRKIPAEKWGKAWISTPRRIRQLVGGET